MVSRLRGAYPMAILIALLGLGPTVVLQSAFYPLSTLVAHDLGTGPTALQVAQGLGNAAYPIGAVLGAQLAQRHVLRPLFLGYEAAFVVGSLVTALAPGIWLFGAGRVVEGLTGGAMLVSSLPPAIARFGPQRLPRTAVMVNLGIFGVSALGPIVGGLAAGAGSWRPLFLATTALGAVGWVVAHLGYERFDPPHPDLGVDAAALVLTVVGSTTTFVGTALLNGAGASSPAFLVPLVVGLAALLLLLVVEARRDESLMPVRALSTQLPVTGTLVASIGGASFVCSVQLVQVQLSGTDPARLAGMLWTMPVGVAVTAVLFGLLLRTRFVPVLVDAGLAVLVVAPLLLLGDSSPSEPVVLLVGLLLGLGAGATVSPGLFLVGWAVPSTELGRAFALVQLLRSTVTYAAAPVLLYVALTVSLPTAVVATAALAGAGLVVALVLPAVSGARLHAPDVEAWLDGGQALPSPQTAGLVRSLS